MNKLRVKEILKEKGITQKRLVDELGVSEIGLSKMIGEKGNQSLSTLDRVSKALDCSIIKLFRHKSGFTALIDLREHYRFDTVGS